MISDAIDYCQSEHFNVTCPRNDVILMTHAQYGRMRTGRCATHSAQLGCSVDVLPFFDQRCSGRRACVVYVADPGINKLEPCAKDFTSYLSAAYVCVKGKLRGYRVK